ncbi:ribonuclease 1 [Tanacetum coccineum]
MNSRKARVALSPDGKVDQCPPSSGIVVRASTYDDNAYILRKAERKKHGKYSGLGVREYSEKSLQLLKDDGQGLKPKLAAEKTTPSIYNTYKLADIQAAVKKINGGFSGTIICIQRQGSSNKQQIQEIRFRYTNDFRKNILSPSNCGPEILFPAPGFGLT